MEFFLPKAYDVVQRRIQITEIMLWILQRQNPRWTECMNGILGQDKDEGWADDKAEVGVPTINVYNGCGSLKIYMCVIKIKNEIKMEMMPIFPMAECVLYWELLLLFIYIYFIFIRVNFKEYSL